MVTLLESLSFQNSLYLELVYILLFILFCNKLILGHILNGLIFFTITSIINWVIFLQIAETEFYVKFFGIEVLFYVVILILYSRIISNIHLKTNLIVHLESKIARRFSFLMLLGNLGFAYFTVADESTSRIAYMTNQWFSFVRPVLSFCIPYSYLIVAAHLRKFSIFTSISLLVIIVTSDLSGSKASFVIYLVTFVLFLRDMRSGFFGFNAKNIMAVTTLITLAGLITLFIMEVTFTQIGVRIILFAEPTLMNFNLSDITAPCNDNSLINKLHRGIGRLVGDDSSLNIDTLYGYALMLQYVDTNALTGPNARIGPYFLCNNENSDLLLLSGISLLYLGLLLLLFRVSANVPLRHTLISAFVLSVLISSNQDFYILMSSSLPALFFSIMLVIKRRGII